MGIVSMLWLPHLYNPILDEYVKRYPTKKISKDGTHTKLIDKLSYSE